MVFVLHNLMNAFKKVSQKKIKANWASKLTHFVQFWNKPAPKQSRQKMWFIQLFGSLDLEFDIMKEVIIKKITDREIIDYLMK